jgi:hypothetical protein
MKLKRKIKCRSFFKKPLKEYFVCFDKSFEKRKYELI